MLPKPRLPSLQLMRCTHLPTRVLLERCRHHRRPALPYGGIAAKALTRQAQARDAHALDAWRGRGSRLSGISTPISTSTFHTPKERHLDAGPGKHPPLMDLINPPPLHRLSQPPPSPLMYISIWISRTALSPPPVTPKY